MTNIFKNRYQAEKERRNNPFLNGNMPIVKVDGGFVIMDVNEYQTWKKQK